MAPSLAVQGRARLNFTPSQPLQIVIIAGTAWGRGTTDDKNNLGSVICYGLCCACRHLPNFYMRLDVFCCVKGEISRYLLTPRVCGFDPRLNILRADHPTEIKPVISDVMATTWRVRSVGSPGETLVASTCRQRAYAKQPVFSQCKCVLLV